MAEKAKVTPIEIAGLLSYTLDMRMQDHARMGGDPTELAIFKKKYLQTEIPAGRAFNSELMFRQVCMMREKLFAGLPPIALRDLLAAFQGSNYSRRLQGQRLIGFLEGNIAKAQEFNQVSRESFRQLHYLTNGASAVIPFVVK